MASAESLNSFWTLPVSHWILDTIFQSQQSQQRGLALVQTPRGHHQWAVSEGQWQGEAAEVVLSRCEALAGPRWNALGPPDVLRGALLYLPTLSWRWWGRWGIMSDTHQCFFNCSVLESDAGRNQLQPVGSWYGYEIASPTSQDNEVSLSGLPKRNNTIADGLPEIIPSVK